MSFGLSYYVLAQREQRNSKIHGVNLILISTEGLLVYSMKKFHIFENELSQKCLVMQVNDLPIPICGVLEDQILLGFE